MKNRSIYAVLTRFGIIAAVLATLVLIAPAVSAADPLEFDYPENGTDAVATFSATDADGDAINWSLGGVDADDFEIDGGVLTFKKSPNFEGATDRDEVDNADQVGDQGKGDNVYKITVKASGGSQDVEVSVTDVDEAGSVSFTQPQPQVSRDLTAKFSDQDGGDSPSWQWSRGLSMDGPWTEIAGAQTAARKPSTADIDNYLRATVTYEDEFGDQTASGVTANPVEARTLSNARPSFGDIAPITVDENTKGAIGDPILATDGNNDVLLYALDGASDADNAKFSIGESTGQLSLKDPQNFEAPGAATPEANADETADDLYPYTVMIKATDPSGAVGRKTVTVYLKDVNESPAFQAPSKDQKTLYIDENVAATGDGEFLYAHKTDRAVGDRAAVYNATDNDNSRDTDPDSAVVYTLEGAGDDEEAFSLTEGALTSNELHDFEDQSSYSLTIVATTTDVLPDDDDNRGSKIGKLNVTVMVVNGEDPGTVELTAREPQVGRAVLAKLSDPDGGETAVEWQWYRGGASPATTVGILVALEDDPEPTNGETTDVCTDADGGNVATAESPCVIGGAESALYTPGADDVLHLLHAVATYKDAIASDQDLGTAGDQLEENAGVASERPVEISNAANTAPVFPDQDLNTAGDQSETAMRSVAENAEGANLGEPITAGDGNGDLLIYTISGDDAGSFNIGRKDGQLSAKVALDYEAQDMHMVMVTATDPSGAYDMITVMIEVTDADDAPTISLVRTDNAGPAFEGATASRSVDENMPAGTNVGDAVAATDEDDDTLTYSLSGSAYFEIDSATGQISTTMMLDYEAMSSHTVTVMADDGAGVENATASIDVTINVGDMYPDCTVADNMGLTNDCEALLDAKADLGGDLNWDTDTAMADWKGVTMSGDPMRVTALDLEDAGLEGSISAALGRLSAVTRLHLRTNPGLTGEIPDALGNLSYLTYLNLHSNGHTGPIPDLSGASMLEKLYLANNDLDGGIPASLNGLTNLTHLWLWGNQLTGGIPDLSGLTMLDELKLAKNMLDGEINAMYLPQKVSWLIIDSNSFSGDIPDLSGLTSLRLLWLHTNALTGSVPSGGMLPASLDDLNLRDNMLTGDIPDLSALVNLTRLRLHNNSLSGVIPGSLGGLDSLLRLWLHNEVAKGLGDNMFSGIDAGLADLDDTLTHLYLNGNSFAEGTCLPGDLATMVVNNDFAAAGLAACPADDGS